MNIVFSSLLLQLREVRGQSWDASHFHWRWWLSSSLNVFIPPPPAPPFCLGLFVCVPKCLGGAGLCCGIMADCSWDTTEPFNHSVSPWCHRHTPLVTSRGGQNIRNTCCTKHDAVRRERQSYGLYHTWSMCERKQWVKHSSHWRSWSVQLILC